MSDKNICLVSLPAPFLTDDHVFPNLGVLYLKAALDIQRIQAIVHDGPIIEIPPGFSCYAISATTPQFPLAIQAMDIIRRNNPDSKIIIGGPHATVDPQSCKAFGFDTVVQGHGELTLPLALEYPLNIVSSYSYAPLLPDRDAIDLRAYKYAIDGIPATSLMTSRGCPYSCAFCCKSAGKVTIHPADFVVKELRLLKEKYGYEAFMFFDDIFIVDPVRLGIILDAITPWNVKWRGFVRADMLLKLGDDVVRKMAESGCVEVGMGIESGSEKILKIINKGEDIATIKSAVKLLHRHDIRVKGFFIVGLPGESRETVDDTAQFCFEAQLDDIDFTIFQPFKGSYIYNNKETFDISWNKINLEKMWYKGRKNCYESQVWTSSLTREEIVEARDYLERRFKK